MSVRGQYAKGIAKRGEILDAALRVIAAEGASNASIRQIADAVGLSQNGLLHYFGSRDALVVEVLRHRDELAGRGAEEESAAFHDAVDLEDFIERLLRIVRRNARTPGLVQLFASLVAESAEPGHPAHRFFAERYIRIRERTSAALTELKARGLVRADIDAAQEAIRLIALIDGLQNQWLHDPDIDMVGQLDAHLRGLAPRG